MKKLEREKFIKLFVGQIVVSLFVVPLLVAFLVATNSAHYGAPILGQVVMILGIAFNGYIFARRLTDLELSPYFAVVAALPTVGLLMGITLCFMKKCHGKNILNILKKLEN